MLLKFENAERLFHSFELKEKWSLWLMVNYSHRIRQ